MRESASRWEWGRQQLRLRRFADGNQHSPPPPTRKEDMTTGDNIVNFYRDGLSFILAVDMGDEGYFTYSISRREMQRLNAETEFMLLDPLHVPEEQGAYGWPPHIRDTG